MLKVILILIKPLNVEVGTVRSSLQSFLSPHLLVFVLPMMRMLLARVS